MNITFSIPWCGLGGLGGVVVVVGVFGIAVVNAVCWAGFDCRAGSGLAEASSSPAVWRDQRWQIWGLAGPDWLTGSLGWRPLRPTPWCCSTSPRPEESGRTLVRELASSVGSRVEEEGDQAVDGKPGGRVVLPRLSININNPSHPTQPTPPHHYTTQWHSSETHQSPTNTIYNIFNIISGIQYFIEYLAWELNMNIPAPLYFMMYNILTTIFWV